MSTPCAGKSINGSMIFSGGGLISCRPLDRRMLVVSVDYKINKRDKLKFTFSHIARPHSGRAIWEGQRDIMFFWTKWTKWTK